MAKLHWKSCWYRGAERPGESTEGGEPRNAEALGRELSFSPEFNRKLNMDVCYQDGPAEFIYSFICVFIVSLVFKY